MGRRHEEDRPVDPPPAPVRYLFAWFQEMSCGRGIAGMGAPMLLTATEIDAWARLRRITLQDWELDTIRALDAAYIRIICSKD